MSYSATLIDGKDDLEIHVLVDRCIAWGDLRMFVNLAFAFRMRSSELLAMTLRFAGKVFGLPAGWTRL